MQRIALFVYGSLLVPKILRALLDREPPRHAALLPDHRRAALRGQGFPGIVPAPGVRTAGAVIMVSTRELECLDAWEADFFRRRTVGVHLQDGTRLAAQTYLLAASHRHLAAARAWSPEDFSQRHAPVWASRARRWRRDRDRSLRHTSGQSPLP